MKRVRYISRATASTSKAAVDLLVTQAKTNNRKNDITGVLLSAGGMFYQLLEGPDAAVASLFERIKADKRHHDIVLLESEAGDIERICPDWTMREVRLAPNVTDLVAHMLGLIVAQRRVADDAVASLEAFTWQQLLESAMEDAAGE